MSFAHIFCGSAGESPPVHRSDQILSSDSKVLKNGVTEVTPCEHPETGVQLFDLRGNQYIMSGLGAGIGGFFSGMSATRLSVVRTIEATEAAFSRALRQTFVGSTMPSLIMSP